MKKALISLLIAGSVLSICLVSGCGQKMAETAAGGSGTVASAGAKSGSSAASAIGTSFSAANLATSVGGLAGSGGNIRTSGVRSIRTAAVAGQPPDAFFNATISSTGYITIVGAGIISGETVEIRMKTRSGSIINDAFLNSIKLATFEGFDWKDLSSPGAFIFPNFADSVEKWIKNPPAWDDADPARQAAFYASPLKYRPMSTFWDYIVWSFVLRSPSMETAVENGYRFAPVVRTPPQPPPNQKLNEYPKLSSPEATGSDIIGEQDVHVYGTHSNGEKIDLVLIASVDASGRPVSMTGTGAVTRVDGVVMQINVVQNFAVGAYSGGTMDIVNVTEKMHIVMVVNADRSATGKVYDTSTSPETQIGTLVLTSAGTGYFEDMTGNKTNF